MNSDFDEARRHLKRLQQDRPSSISVAALGVQSKAPHLLLAARAAVMWRTEELARCACDMLEKDDLAAGLVLTRAVTESAAFIWRLKQLMETRHRYTPEKLHNKLTRMLLGEKSNADPNLPDAFNIMTFIDHTDKQLPGFKTEYEHLSQFAHPGWSGVSGLFSAPHDQLTHTTQFGRGMEGTLIAKDIACDLLVYSLAIFEDGCNYISKTLPDFLAELEPLSQPKKI